MIQIVLCLLTLSSYLVIFGTNGQDVNPYCSSNQCSNGERCFTRSANVLVDAEQNFVCECRTDGPGIHNKMGYECAENGVHREIITCYGVQCRESSYSSPNYPGLYIPRRTVLFLLYIPYAQRIDFTFDDPFEIEVFKDELYVGVGLQYRESQLNFRSELPNKYFFEGKNVPEDFNLATDTVWMLFITDRNIEFSGFRLSWSANIDQTPPIITSCPDNIVSTITVGINDSAVVTWEEPSAEDTGPVQVAQTHRSGDTFPMGITAVEYTFSDEVRNQAVCQFNVTVIGVDEIPPVINNCPSFIFQQVSIGSGGAAVSWVEPSANDESGHVILSERSHRPGSVFPPGIVDVVYAFRDLAGNEARCTFGVTVEEVDREPPIITNCPRNIVEEINVGTGGTTIDWQDPTVSDNSGTVSLISQSHTTGSFFLPGTSRAAYVYEDSSRNRAVCSFTITVIEVDTEPPQIQCINDISINIDLNIGGARVDWQEPAATDNSGFVTLTSKSHNPGAFFPPGERRVIYVFSDGAGNSAECSFTVTVTEVDSELPQVTCPVDIRQEIPLGSGGTAIRWDEPIVSDNSGNVILIYQSHRSGNFFATGFTEVVYRYRDPAANMVECSFFVRITEIDTIPPSVACTADIVQVIPIGSGGVVVTWTEPVATDNSGTVRLTVKTHSPGTLFETGSTVVMYEYEDPSGNSASCEFNVTVTEVDDSPPDISQCPDNMDIEIDLSEGGAIVNWTEPTATDNSGIVVLSLQTHLTGSYFAPGISSVTYLYEDPANNIATCIFTVSVRRVDTTPPNVICPGDVLLTILTGMGGAGITWVEPTVTDNSGNAFLREQTHVSGQYFDVGTTEVTYWYADFSENEGSCTFTVRLDEANPCDNAPCFNGGLCVIQSVAEYTCLCQECFSGDQCQIELDACSNNQCENGAICMPHPGSCDQYFCECSECFTGRFCQQTIDPCENHQCQNGAQCLSDSSSCSTYSCQCTSCFTGDFCQELLDPCQDHQCQNLGTCVPLPSGACSGYTCQCPSCFTGIYCQERYSLCDLSPCQNGGSCLSGMDSCFVFKCDCPPCWTGYMCEIPVPSQCEFQPCMNEGTCTSIEGACDQYTCTCPPGFAGVNCEIGSSVNENACSSQPCLNGGSCLTMEGDHYVCLCAEEYVGIDCGTPKANFLIYDACRNFPCEGASTCYNSFNSLSTPQGAFTRQYTCECPPRYTGRNCGEFRDNAISKDVCSHGNRAPCQNGGLCVNAYHNYDRNVDYLCVCPEGWSGHNCETPYISACDSSPCKNNGVCTSAFNYFFCSCEPGYLGTTCEIDIVDIVPPIVSNCPPSTTISAGDDITARVSWTEPSAVDNSGSVTLFNQTHEPNEEFGVGTTAVTYIFVDPSKNAASCTFFVTVTSRAVDTTPPRISSCPNDITVTTATGQFTSVVQWKEPTARDNSGEAVTRRRTHFPGNIFPYGTTSVEYTFTDPSGNEAVCGFDVTVVLVDTTPPVLTYCPDNIQQLVTSGALFTTIYWDRPNATDESGPVNLTFSTLSSESLFVRVDGVPFEVMYVFEDQAGNTVECIFTVSAISSLPDTLPPIITGCPSDIFITIRPGAFTSRAMWVEPTATDESNIPPVVDQSHQPGALFSVGDTAVSYLFSDSAGNRAECSFTVTVTDVDTTPPIVTGCPVNELVLTTAPGTTYALIEWDTPRATDDSGPAALVSQSGARSPTFAQVNMPPLEVEYVFEDFAGNQAVCRFTVDAVVGIPDTTPPTINNCPADVSVTIPPSNIFSTTATWPEPTAFDDSGRPPTLTKSHEPGLSQFPVGVTLVSYRYMDAARNRALCVFSVSVIRDSAQDTSPPEIFGCPDDIATLATIGNNMAIVTWTPPTAADDTSSSVTLRPLPPNVRPGALFPVGTTEVTYAFVDEADNEASCTFDIIVIPAIDITPPEILNCPSNITAQSQNGYNTTVTWPTPTATDNSGKTPMLIEQPTNQQPGGSFPVGETEIRYTFSDEAGNISMCSFMVTVFNVQDIINRNGRR